MKNGTTTTDRGLVRAVDLIVDYFEAQKAYEEAKKKLGKVKARITQQYGPGRYKDCTIYDVRSTTVREHSRKGFTALRWRRS